MSQTNLPHHRNECHLAGVLTRDPIIKYTPSAKCVANLTLVTKHEQYSEFHRVVAWEKLAEKVEKLKKGDFVKIVGRLATRSWDDAKTGQKKYVTEVISFQISIPDEEPAPLTPDATKGGTAIARAILRPAEGVRDADPF